MAKIPIRTKGTQASQDRDLIVADYSRTISGRAIASLDLPSIDG